MLDDVERRSLLVEPAREDAAVLAVGAAHVQLHEGAGQLLDLPGCGGLAGAQAHDHVANPDRLARPQGQVPPQPVALVEQADHGDPLGHRCRPRGELRDRLGNVDGLVLDFGLALPVGLVRAPGRAGGERERRREAQS